MATFTFSGFDGQGFGLGMLQEALSYELGKATKIDKQPAWQFYQDSRNYFAVSGSSFSAKNGVWSGTVTDFVWVVNGVKIFDVSGLTISAATLQAAIAAKDYAAIGTLAVSGKDEFNGSALDDTFFSGKGADQLFGKDGNDNLDGGSGADQLFGGNGNDSLDGGSGADTLNGDAGHDVLTGGAGNDEIYGGAGNDLIYSGAALLTLTAADAESIYELNRMYGGAGNDTLIGSASDDMMFGGAGADNFYGGYGYDMVIYTGGAGLTVDMLNPDSSTGEATGDVFVGIEEVQGTAGNDQLLGDNTDNRLIGGAGNDTLDGREGNDTLIGGAGADRLYGGAGQDTVSYAASSAAVIVDLSKTGVGGDAQGDTYASIDWVTGSRFADRITGTAADEVLEGRAGSDKLYGGAGNDTFYDGPGNDDVYGGTGNDTFYAEADTNNLYGGDGDDNFYGGAGTDAMFGGAGTDGVSYWFVQLGVTANLTDSSKNRGYATGDTYSSIENLTGSNYSDTLTGNVRDNIISGLSGNDVINGAGGNDTLWGGGGADTFIFDDKVQTGFNGNTSVMDFGSEDVLRIAKSLVTDANNNGKIDFGDLKLIEGGLMLGKHIIAFSNEYQLSADDVVFF